MRNTFRFALGNLADFDPSRDAVARRPTRGDGPLDARDAPRSWSPSAGSSMTIRFHRVFHALHDFCVVDLSAFYFDMLKDRLYTFAPNNRARRSAQTAIYRIASALAAAPGADPGVHHRGDLEVFAARKQAMPAEHSSGAASRSPIEWRGFPDEALESRWAQLLEVRSAVLNALEQARNAKQINQRARSSRRAGRR